jgi:CRISPR/Cas system CMR subunit Cmr4 (Cas7 group RAMP superfamily)
MEESTDYSDNKLHNLDKNMLVDTLKHTSDIMTALSSKVYIMEEEIKNINNQLTILSNENKLLKESFKNDNFDKLYKANQNINIIYDDEKKKELKQNETIINKSIEVKKEDVPENIITNRKKNNLFIRKI